MNPATPSLKKNVVANYLGYAWRTAINLAFVPVYIRLLGVEAYGLIGIFATLQVMFSLLDVGLRPALTREMARFTAGGFEAGDLRNLLRSIEWITAGTALTTALVVWSISGWLSREWVQPDQLDPTAIARAFTLMGVVTALRFVEGIYTACLTGMQRQVLENGLSSTIAGIRAIGAVAVLVFVSNSVLAFFIWQGLTSVLAVGVLGFATYVRLPASGQPTRFSWPALKSIWRFAAGSMAITFLAIVLTQIDKILLSRLLPLEIFGHYALAAVVAGALTSVSIPIVTAFYPKFTFLVAAGMAAELRTAYHQASQLISVVSGAAAVVLITFAEPLLFVWTDDAALSAAVAPIMALLVCGTLLNSLMMLPYHLQLAHGWVSLTIRINIAAVLLVVPAILILAPRYGPAAAGAVWVGLNAGYLLIGVGLMHRRLLSEEKWRWYWFDTAAPLVAAAATAGALRILLPDVAGRLPLLLQKGACAVVVLVAAALASSFIRRFLLSKIGNACRLIKQAVRTKGAFPK